MIESKKELEWFILGLAIAGGREKFKEENSLFEETSDDKGEEDGGTMLNIELD